MYILIFWSIFIAFVCLMWYMKAGIYGVLYTLSAIAGALMDIACQAWIDLSAPFRRNKRFWNQQEDDDSFWHK